MTHTELINAGVDYLNARGFYVWSNKTGRRSGISYGHKGSGDILGFFPDGLFFSGEAKIGKDTQKEDQVKFQMECESRKAVYILYHDIPELQSKLVKYMKD